MKYQEVGLFLECTVVREVAMFCLDVVVFFAPCTHISVPFFLALTFLSLNGCTFLPLLLTSTVPP